MGMMQSNNKSAVEHVIIDAAKFPRGCSGDIAELPKRHRWGDAELLQIRRGATTEQLRCWPVAATEPPWSLFTFCNLFDFFATFYKNWFKKIENMIFKNWFMSIGVWLTFFWIWNTSQVWHQIICSKLLVKEFNEYYHLNVFDDSFQKCAYELRAFEVGQNNHMLASIYQFSKISFSEIWF